MLNLDYWDTITSAQILSEITKIFEPQNNSESKMKVLKRVIQKSYDAVFPTEKIVYAAIITSKKVYLGKRHAELIRQIIFDDPDNFKVFQDQQGFWTDKHRFVSRVEAREIAIRNKQLPPHFTKTLCSEDLW